MAPAASLPEIDMSSMQDLDIQQSYWLLFQKMKKDFVHKADLQALIAELTISGGAVATQLGPQPVVGARAIGIVKSVEAEKIAAIYKKLTKTGGIVRKEAVEGLEVLTS